MTQNHTFPPIGFKMLEDADQKEDEQVQKQKEMQNLIQGNHFNGTIQYSDNFLANNYNKMQMQLNSRYISQVYTYANICRSKHINKTVFFFFRSVVHDEPVGHCRTSECAHTIYLNGPELRAKIQIRQVYCTWKLWEPSMSLKVTYPPHWWKLVTLLPHTWIHPGLRRLVEPESAPLWWNPSPSRILYDQSKR